MHVTSRKFFNKRFLIYIRRAIIFSLKMTQFIIIQITDKRDVAVVSCIELEYVMIQVLHIYKEEEGRNSLQCLNYRLVMFFFSIHITTDMCVIWYAGCVSECI